MLEIEQSQVPLIKRSTSIWRRLSRRGRERPAPANSLEPSEPTPPLPQSREASQSPSQSPPRHKLQKRNVEAPTRSRTVKKPTITHMHTFEVPYQRNNETQPVQQPPRPQAQSQTQPQPQSQSHTQNQSPPPPQPQIRTQTPPSPPRPVQPVHVHSPRQTPPLLSPIRPRALASAVPTRPFPSLPGIQTAPWTVPLTPTQTYSLVQGYLPQEMSDKWFIYSEGPDRSGKLKVHFHRSWTGMKVAELFVVIDVEGDGDGRVVGIKWNGSAETERLMEEEAKYMIETTCEWVLGVEFFALEKVGWF